MYFCKVGFGLPKRLVLQRLWNAMSQLISKHNNSSILAAMLPLKDLIVISILLLLSCSRMGKFLRR